MNLEAAVFVLACWGVWSFAWLLMLSGRLSREIDRLDEDDDSNSDAVLESLRAAVKVLEENE